MSSNCLIVSNAAFEFADAVSHLSEDSIPLTVCASVEEVLDAYAGERIVFGDPDMVAEALPQLTDVEWVQSTWAGVAPLLELDRHNYTLTGVKDVFGPQISEYVLGYLLAHELRILERMEQQRKRNWFPSPSGALQGKHLGIMGTGSIGSHIARTAIVFEMKVTGLNSTGATVSGFDNVLHVSQLNEFLKPLNYLVTTLPHTEHTHNLLDAAALEKLPAHAYIVNVGRGNVIDDAGLIAALHGGALAGAALDVFDKEPIPEDSPLWNAPNLSITAHIAALSHSSLIVPIFLDNYRRYSENQPLAYVVDFEKGY